MTLAETVKLRVELLVAAKLTTEDDFSKAIGRIVDTAVQSWVQSSDVEAGESASGGGAGIDSSRYPVTPSAIHYDNLRVTAEPLSGGHGSRTRNRLPGT